MRASRSFVRAIGAAAALALIGSVAVAAAPGAVNYLPVASPKQVLSATLDCWRVVGPAGADRVMLHALGWKPRTLSVRVAARLRIFGKAAQGPVIILADEGAEKKGCIVGASMANSSDATAITRLLAARVGVADAARTIHDDGHGLTLRTADKRLVALPNGQRTAVNIYVVSLGSVPK